MAEPKVAVVAKKTRKREGYRRVMVTLTEAQAKQLDELAVADDRQGGATEILTVIVKRNFDVLVKTLKPAVLDFHQVIADGQREAYKRNMELLYHAEEIPGFKSRHGEVRNVAQEVLEAKQREAEAVR